MGSLFHFLTQFSLITFNNYIGIDFALQEEIQLAPNAKLIKEDIGNYNFRSSGKSLIVLCNVACYLSDDLIKILATNASKSDCDILILDPVPGLFWDATFDKVKLHYRSSKKMNKLISPFSYKNTLVVIDYLWNIGKWYLTPLSYATLYTYNELAD